MRKSLIHASSRFPINSGLFQGVLQLWIPSIVGCKGERPRITIDHWWTQLCIRIDLAINTVSNSQVATSTANGHVLAFIDCNDSTDSCHEDSTISALLDLQTVYTRSNVHVRIFAANETDIFAWWV